MANPEHLKILKQGVEVWNRWLITHSDMRVDLSSADLAGLGLSRAVLAKVDFRDAYMQETVLSETLLTEAVLMRSNLTGANLAFADLQNCNLQGACLRKASLRNANLVKASMMHADLTGADLGCAQLGLTLLSGLDLTDVQGLNAAFHNAPSYVSVDTLYRSRGKDALKFLRRCGAPPTLIEYLPSLRAPAALDLCSGFISYSHGDKSFARRLHEQLQSRGISSWLDEYDLKPGDRILDVVDDAIRLHDKILLCCSEASLSSWWVKDEIRKAMERERRDGRDIIIPLMVDRYLLDGWEHGLAADLRSRLAADFTGWEHDNAKFEEQFEKVVKALRTDDRAWEMAPQSKP